MAFVSYDNVVKAIAGYVADHIIENAKDNDEDVATYSTDEEVVMLYLKELASGVSAALPAEIAAQNTND